MSDKEIKAELAAAQETIEALSRRIQRIEGGSGKSPFQQQLKAYQKRIEVEALKLKQSQDWARLLVEKAMDAIIGMDSHGNITHWNPKAELMFGWKEVEVLGKPLSNVSITGSLGATEYSQSIDHYLSSAEGTLMKSPVEARAFDREGSELPVELTISTLKRGSDDLFVVTLRDITDRKQAEKALKDANENLESLVEKRTREVKQSEERFALAMRGANDGLWDWDLETGHIYYSPRWKSMLGYEEHELDANLDSWAALVHPDDKGWVIEKVQDYLQGRADSFEVEMRMKHRDGYEVIVLSRAYLVHSDSDDKAVRLVGTHVDITAYKRLENQLLQSQKMEAIGTLVGGIAHDFNNMLGAIQGNVYLTKLLLNNNPEAIEKLASIERLGLRAADMVQQLLTFARKDTVETERLYLNEFMQEAFKLSRNAIPENIESSCKLCDELLIIDGSATQLQQVLMNLLNNASHAVADRAQPCIDCSLTAFISDAAFLKRHPSLKEGRFASITVQDNGHGIAEDHLNNIFEPFFTTKEVGEGTGLGLAMVYGAIQSHGGAIEVESRLEEGTAFHIYLPLEVEKAKKLKDGEAQTLEGQGETILLVDDEIEMREVTKEVLIHLGYNILTAADGEEALQLFKAHKDEIKLAILDVVMPRMGGVDAARHIRKINTTIPIIFATGYDRKKTLKTGDELDRSIVLNKPFSVADISQSLRRMIET